MSLELVNTFATLGTFVVIAATAIAAIVQLRHARGSNQIAALNELREIDASIEVEDARHFVRSELNVKLRDPDFRYQLLNRSVRSDENRPLLAKILLLGNYYEAMGVLMKARLVDSELAMEQWGAAVTLDWKHLAPIVAMFRREHGAGQWENFEYATVLAQNWISAHPSGAYPSGIRRIPLKDEWLEVDAQYAASLATA